MTAASGTPHSGLSAAASDPEEAAAQAGLRYVDDSEPGWRRVRRGRGFIFQDVAGRRITDEHALERVRALAIPPAWTDVWISPDPRAHLQASGRDDRQRKQYLYHEDWRQIRDEIKFERLREFGLVLPDIRARTGGHLARRCLLTRDQAVAGVIALLDRTLARIGNPRYAEENESFGLTTLRREHVEVIGSRVRLCFPAKSGQVADLEVTDKSLARFVRSCLRTPSETVFAFRDRDAGGEEWRPVDAELVNAELRAVAGGTVSAKDFRTWGGTAATLEALAHHDRPVNAKEADQAMVEAVDEAAERLGNTRAVCRSAYVHPLLDESLRSGALHEAWRRSRGSPRRRRSESALLWLLDRA